MSAAKKKSRQQKKESLKHTNRAARASRQTSSETQAQWLTFENVIGFFVCLIIIAAPLVFHAQIRNFADLPQRTFVQATVALFCVLGLMRAASRRCYLEVPRSLCCCALAAFACWALLSILWSSSPYDALYASVHWSACVFAALGIVAWLRSDIWLTRIAGSIVISGAIVTAVALSQQFLGMTSIPSVKIPSAAFGNPNVLAEFLCVTIAFSACAGWFARRRLPLAALCLFVCAVELFVLSYTRCRSAWLALLCFLVWAGGLLLKRFAGWKFCVLALALVLCVGGYAGFMLATQPALKRAFDGSAQYRLIVWSNTFELLKKQPVLGHGAGSFPYMYAAVTNTNQTDARFDKTVQIRRTHNDFLQTAVELGVPGFLLLVFFAGGVLILALRLMGSQRCDREQFIVFAASGALVASLVNSFFGFPFQRAVTPLLTCMSAGMVIAMYCRERKAFFCVKNRGGLIAAAFVFAAAGFLMLWFNLSSIESDRYFKKALAMEKKQQNAKALDFSLRAIGKSPGRMDVLTTVGRAYITTGRLQEGIDALQTVTSRHPYSLNALFILGVGYANAGRVDEALEIFRRVLTIKPDFIEARKIVSRLKARGRVKVNLR